MSGLPPDVPTSVDVLEQVCADICMGVRTAVPGVVVAYNPATRTAKVQPLRRGAVPDGQTYELPIVPDAPVLWPRFGNMVIVGRLNPGDSVLLIVSDRELDPFLLSPASAPYDPTNPRTHDLSDAMVLPQLSPTTKPITVGLSGAQLYLGQETGLAGIGIGIDTPNVVMTSTGPGTLQLGSAAAAQPVMLGTLATTALNTFASAISAANGVLDGAVTTWAAIVPVTAPGNNALAGAFTTWAAAYGTAVTALATALAASLSVQVLAQ